MEFGRDDEIEIHRNVGQADRMVFADNAEAGELQQIVIFGGTGSAAFLGLLCNHAADRDDVSHILLELADRTPEVIERAIGKGGRAGLIVGIDIFDEAGLALLRFAIGQDDGVLALIVPVRRLKTLAPFLIDQRTYLVGEMAVVPGRIGRRRHAHGLDLDHPARSEPGENGIDLAADLVALEIGRAFVIRTGEIPAGHQAPVLEQERAVIDQGRIGQQVGEGRAGMTKSLECNHKSERPPGRGGRPVVGAVSDVAQVDAAHQGIGFRHHAQ